MPRIAISFDVTNAEYARLQALAGGRESVDAYAARVALKGLRGYLEAEAAEARQRAVATLNQAYDSAAPEVQAAVLDALGFVLGPTGDLEPKS